MKYREHSATLSNFTENGWHNVCIFFHLYEHNFPLPTIILGRVAYLGVLSRRSAVNTAGVLIFIVSSPPSISRTTLILSPSSVTSDAKVPWGRRRQHIFTETTLLKISPSKNRNTCLSTQRCCENWSCQLVATIHHLLVHRWNYKATCTNLLISSLGHKL